jgi:2-phosphosulfolactate phosphatase
MRLDAVFAPPAVAPALLTGRLVLVIDVLRASSTIAEALANVALIVVPLECADEVVTRARQFERGEVRLAGERRMLPIPGFDMGNSPREATREMVEGRTVLFTTTNGTAALLAVQGARDVIVASYVNFAAVLALLHTAARGGVAITFVCAGRDRQFSLEDAACAALHARYGDRLGELFADSEHGRALREAGFADDLVVCGTIDAFPVIPVYQDRQLTVLGPDRDR